MDVETGETQTEIAREEVLHLSISTAAFWEGTAVGEALEKNCEKLEEWSEGTIDICIYDGGVMGSDSELIPGVQQGTLSIVNSVSAAQVSVVPEAALLSIPCIFDSPVFLIVMRSITSSFRASSLILSRRTITRRACSCCAVSAMNTGI